MSTQFIDVKGEPTRERQNLSVAFTALTTIATTIEMRPGPLRLSLENRTDERVLPGVWVAGDALHALLARRRPFLTAKRLLSNQIFRDLYGTEHARPRAALAHHQPDLSLHRPQRFDRALRAGRRPRRLRSGAGRISTSCTTSSSAEHGAVVKTIGDAVMATFTTPDRAVAAALAHARGDGAAQRRARRRGPACSRSASTRAPASRSCSTTTRIISARPSTSPPASKALAHDRGDHRQRAHRPLRADLVAARPKGPHAGAAAAPVARHRSGICGLRDSVIP